MSVFIGSIPNAQKDDVALAGAILKKEVDTNNVENELTKILEDSFNEKTFLFNRGREALSFFLKLLDLEEEDEVIVQAFTCVAVVAPVIWNNAKPVYVDIDPKTFNMDLSRLSEKISKRTRAIILQHTFGNIADVEKVRKIVEEENQKRDGVQNKKIVIIEDCAHLFPSLVKRIGAQSRGEVENIQLDYYFDELGRYSDMLFFSFSQDKAISCTQGAMMIVKNKKLLNKAKESYLDIPEPSQKEAIYNARYIKLWSIIKKQYFTKIIPFTNITLGRILIVLFRSLGLIKKQAGSDIKSNGSVNIQKLSEIQQILLLNQVKKVQEINKHREDIVNLYNAKLQRPLRFDSNNKTLLRYPVVISNRGEIKKRLLEKKIIAGNWYSTPVHPLDNNLASVKYHKSICPNAEKTGRNILNLPTNLEVTREIALEIIEVVNTFAKPAII
jgi:perosamine synthetase